MSATDRIVVVNAGSSTVKLAVMAVDRGELHELHRETRECRAGDAEGVLNQALDELERAPDALAVRVVHGGDLYAAPTVVTDEVEGALVSLIPLAPLHNGPAVAIIRALRRRYPSVPAVAVFDTGFHAARPAPSTHYALPEDLVARFGFRRYGFHGMAHASLVEALAAREGLPGDAVNAVTLQLGAGCSACAVRGGRSLETSMGFSPLEGLVMATRSGDVDPAIPVRLMREGFSAERIERLLTRESGLKGMCGHSDMREVMAAAEAGEAAAGLAVEVFCHRLVLAIGGYLTLLETGHGKDQPAAIVFGGGIGTHSPSIRSRVALGLRAWNVVLDERRNARNEPGRISAAGSRPVHALPTDEETIIARDALACL